MSLTLSLAFLFGDLGGLSLLSNCFFTRYPRKVYDLEWMLVIDGGFLPPYQQLVIQLLNRWWGKEMYPIIQIPTDVSSQLEQLGTKAKEWYWDDDEYKVLFKIGRPGTGENWAEKVCCELCRGLSIPHAEYNLATWKGREGVISPSFVPSDGRLIHGNELLAKLHTDYEETVTYNSGQHTIQRIRPVLRTPEIRPPIGWEMPAVFENALDIFIGYIMLDALVSNQDRHHENWGLIISHKYGLTLAPSFDHASSLGRNETDRKRIERLESKDKGRSVAHYCSRARSGLYLATSDNKPLGTVDAFYEMAKMRPASGQYWLSRLETMDQAAFELIIDEVPEEVISTPAKLFALKILEVNRTRLLSQSFEGL